MELLRCSPFLARLYEEAEHCHAQCLSLAPESDKSDEQRFRRALSAVITRNFALQGPALALLPFLDFFNHRSAMRRGSIDWTCSFHERHGSVAMVADRFIAAGEELSFVYVSAPDAVLLVQYAMAPEVLGNLHNMAGVQVFPDDVGAVWEEKWRVLEAMGLEWTCTAAVHGAGRSFPRCGLAAAGRAAGSGGLRSHRWCMRCGAEPGTEEAPQQQRSSCAPVAFLAAAGAPPVGNARCVYRLHAPGAEKGRCGSGGG